MSEQRLAYSVSVGQLTTETIPTSVVEIESDDPMGAAIAAIHAKERAQAQRLVCVPEAEWLEQQGERDRLRTELRRLRIVFLCDRLQIGVMQAAVLLGLDLAEFEALWTRCVIEAEAEAKRG